MSDHNPETEVVLKPEDIFWNIVPIVRDAGLDGIVVELQWGWTAGMTPEQMKNYAEDAPKGYDKVATNLDMARELRDKLNVIIEQYEQIHNERRDAFQKEYQEKYGEILKKAFPMLGEE